MPKFSEYQLTNPFRASAYGMLTNPADVVSLQQPGVFNYGDAVEVDIVPMDLTRPRSEIVTQLRGTLSDIVLGTVVVDDCKGLDELERSQDIYLATHSYFLSRRGIVLDTWMSKVAPNRMAMYLSPDFIAAQVPIVRDGRNRPFRSLGGRFGRVTVGAITLVDIQREGNKSASGDSSAYN